MLVIGVILAAAPASGHVGGTVKHLWTEHIKPRVMNVAYTKEQADARFLETARITYREAEKVTQPGINESLEVYCASGERAISGGSHLVGGAVKATYYGDRPIFKGSSLRVPPVGWTDHVLNDSTTWVMWKVYVFCAS